MKTKKKDRYAYLIAIVVVSWGIVPAFAKLSDLSGYLIAMYVSLVATITIALLITLQGKWKLFKKLKRRDYASIIAIGIVWPLIYSIAYFEAIRYGAALATIVNYTWPGFALLFGWLINKAKPGYMPTIGVGFAVSAVTVTSILENRGNLALALPLVVLGLIAAMSQGFYTSITDKRVAHNPWVITFIIEAVATIGSTIIVLIRNDFLIPSLSTFGYLATIGAISNGLGFWAFLAGSQKSGHLGPKAKSTWLIGMCFVPFAQVLLLPILGIESIGVWKWLGVCLIIIGLAISRLNKK